MTSKIQNEKDLYRLIRNIFEKDFNYEINKYMSLKKGDPDLIIFRNNGSCFFIETKREKGKISFHQTERAKFWESKKVIVYFAFNKKDVDEIKFLEKNLI